MRCGCAGTLPPVQKAVFTLLTGLAPLEQPQLWPDLIDLLLSLLKPHQLQPSDSAASNAAAADGGANVNKHALTALSMEKVVEILAQLYRSGPLLACPWPCKQGACALWQVQEVKCRYRGFRIRGSSSARRRAAMA